MLIQKLISKNNLTLVDECTFLFVVGGQHCGGFEFTQSLSKSLNLNYSNLGREANFFNSGLFESKSLDFYKKSFKSTKKSNLVDVNIDLSWDYCTEGLNLDRIASLEAKKIFVFIKRDPIERFFLAYNYYFSSKVQYILKKYPTEYNKKVFKFLSENESFSLERFCEVEFSSRPVFNALKLGQYQWQIDNIVSKFGSESLLIIDYDNLFDSKYTAINYIPKLETFLNTKVDFNFDWFNKYYINNGFLGNSSKAEIISKLTDYFQNSGS
jgi:hypothetical protein